ncbi:ribonucleotide reductase large subunit, partial [Armillaria nabsnona]
TNGYFNGITPMLRAYDATACYIDQGGNKRPGAFAIYFELWHPDIFEFLNPRKNHGKEESHVRDLLDSSSFVSEEANFEYRVFGSMKQVEANTEWLLICLNKAPSLHEVYADEFEKLYEKYEKHAQIETGNPFMVYKDAPNGSSFHSFLALVSNLCTETIEYSSPDEITVCNPSPGSGT